MPPASTSSTTPQTPYPWINYLGTEEFFGLVSHTGGRLLLLPRRAAAPPDALPLQQRPDRRRRPLLLRPRRRRRLDARLRAGQARARLLRVPRTASATRRSPASGRARGPRSLYFVPLGTNAEVHQVTLTNTLDGGEERQALLVRRVLPVERLGRPDELPAQPLDRRGRGRRRHDLPQDRVPRAPQPLRVLLRERAGRRASTPTARPSSGL